MADDQQDTDQVHAPMKHRQGCPRPGPGRDPLPPEERLVKITARVTQEDLARIKALGEGNISQGIRVTINSTWFEDEE
jgi:hypothetical protein